MIYKCKNCQKPLTGKQRKYCSYSCTKKQSRNIKRSQRRDAVLSLNKKCLFCGKALPFHKQKYCAKKCARSFRNGIKIVTKTCPICKKEFSTSHLNKIYCNSLCQCFDKEQTRKHKRRNGELKLKEIKMCKHCGKEFHPSMENKEQVFCSKKCSGVVNTINMHKSKGKEAHERIGNYAYGTYSKLNHISCQECGKIIVVHYHKKKYCSELCSRISQSKRKGKTFEDKKCKKCGKIFTREYGSYNRKFCSTKCCKKYGSQTGKHRRRKKLRTQIYENIHPYEIFMRDKWHCQHCGISTPKSNRGKFLANAPELDHIIPVAKGGKHIWGNMQLLCRKCNHLKSDGVLPNGEQIRIC